MMCSLSCGRNIQKDRVKLELMQRKEMDGERHQEDIEVDTIVRMVKNVGRKEYTNMQTLDDGTDK